MFVQHFGRKMIRYLKHNDIDKQKWDTCIRNAANGRIYAISWFLDIVSPGWDALIEDNYVSVMPLTWKSKYGMKYIVQPPYTQQLGVFGQQQVTSKQVSTFLNKLPAKFLVARMQLNADNMVPSGIYCEQKDNYILYIGDGYAHIQNRYKGNTRRLIQKIRSEEVLIKEENDGNNLIGLKRLHPPVQLREYHFNMIQNIIATGMSLGQGRILSAYCNGREACASAFFLFDGPQAIFLQSVSSDEGRKQKAMYLIIDEFIRRSDDHIQYLDFEGSSIPGIAGFFRRFGAQCTNYHYIGFSRYYLLNKWLLK